ncbi:MAG: PD40 domain-containing protein, partial [Bryobacterales bacterium]|nr:PD40 domain-containing protein [Bryobacterales bacterium]
LAAPGAGSPSSPAPAKRSGWALAAFAAAILAVLGVAWWKQLRTPSAGASFASLGSATGGRSAAKAPLTRLTSDPGLTSFPAISPDGSLVAYASDRAGAGNLDIWVQQVAGGEPVRLTRGGSDEYEPVFSPDGSRIVFRSEEGQGGLYMVSALGGEPRRLVEFGRSASFAPDGQSIAFAVGSRGVGGAFAIGHSSIYTLALQGGEPYQIAPGFFSAHHPVFSADGRHVLFIGNRQEDPLRIDLWAAPVAVGKNAPPFETGLIPALRAQGLTPSPEPYALVGDALILPLKTGDTVNLWRAPLTRGRFALAAPAEQLTFGTGLERMASVARNGRIVFSSGQENLDLWEWPLDANRGATRGEPRQLTRDAAEDSYPHLSADGRRLAFISRRGGNDDVWTMDTATGKATLLLATPHREVYPKLTRDGATVFFGSVSEGQRTLISMPATGGAATRLCENRPDCGVVRDLTGDGRWLLMQSGPPVFTALFDTASRQSSPLYRHPQFPIYAPKLAPGEKWAAFQTAGQPTVRTLWAAPFRTSGGPVPVEEWVQVTDGKHLDRNPAWSPDGTLLYFLSERDSFRCVWAQRLEVRTRRPVGEPFAVAHFHNAATSLGNIDGPGQVSVMVGADRLIYSAAALTANIWVTELR